MKHANWMQFKFEAEVFMKNLGAQIEVHRLKDDTKSCDHICFRVGSLEEYNSYKTFLEDNGTLLIESLINGRNIATFHLKEAFQSPWGELRTIELPSPKPGTHFETGFEHCEFVISKSLNDFIQERPDLKFKPYKRKTLNTEIASETLNGALKFHNLSLPRVIEIEKSKIQEIVFDLDGTLVNSREQVYRTNQKVFSKALGREVSFEEAKEKFYTQFPQLFAAYGVTDPRLQEECLRSWGEFARMEIPPLFEGAKETLLQLGKKGLALHIWTARDKDSTMSLLEHHGILNFFASISCCTQFSSKPNVESLSWDFKLKAPQSLLMIGDSATDMTAAKNIGAIAGVAGWDPYLEESVLLAAGAELPFQNLTSVLEYLGVH